jgi:hypothetical protein
MGLDIRLPIGVLFTVFGLILVFFGLFSDPALYVRHSLGININLEWGLVLLCFGMGMLLLVRVRMRSSESVASKGGDRHS